MTGQKPIFHNKSTVIGKQKKNMLQIQKNRHIGKVMIDNRSLVIAHKSKNKIQYLTKLKRYFI